MKILTAEQMREMDRLTVERCAIPYATLMETAGARVVEAIVRKYGPVAGKSFAVFCGKGNNGGDGGVIAGLLYMRGAQVEVFLFNAIDALKGEARKNLEIIRGLAERGTGFGEGRLSFREITTSGRIEYVRAPQFIIDALLGTGLSRGAEGLLAQAIESINDARTELSDAVTVISVDIPSGIPSDSGQLIGPYVRSDLTVSFTRPKPGNVLSPANEANGELIVAGIGTPDWLVEEASSRLELVESGRISQWLSDSRRSPHAHKNTAGDALLIAGSRGKTGAAALASETILRAGAGLVTVATSASAQAVLVAQTRPEVMTESLEETTSGAIAREAVSAALSLALKKNVIALGPGLSSSDESLRMFVRQVVDRRSAPMVIDADGLNALAPWPQELKGTAQLPIILTPHPAEMARLIGRSNADVVADRLGVAREFASAHHVIVVLKGSRSIIAGPDGEAFINPTGNAGMATAGSGDVLTGLIAGLLAQRPVDPLGATIAGVYLHGLAGDLAAARFGMRSMIASDLIAALSDAILQTGGDAERGAPAPISMI
jgi:hydroxyethylthiazole kinase-like uncharacterized protein yjeF